MPDFSPLQLIFEASFGNNTAITVGSGLTTAINNYIGTPLLTPLANAVANSTSALVNPTDIVLLASNSVPALANSPPDAYVSALGNIISQYNNISPPNPNLGNVAFTDIVLSVANSMLGNGQSGVFAQIFQGSQGFVSQSNDYVNALNVINNRIAPAFTNYNDLITGDLTRVTLATLEFGQDLERLGLVIDLENLENLGSPAVLLGQIIKYYGFPPLIQQALLVQNVSDDIVLELGFGSVEVTDTVNKQIYTALNTVTIALEPDLLSQILQALRVTTPNITSLVDLLNPVKMFPTSFPALSVPTVQGSTAIYLNSQGDVNSNLLTLLPGYVINTVANV